MTIRQDELHRGVLAPRRLLGVVVTGCFFVATIVVVSAAIRPPPHVDRLTVDNPLPWQVDVDITSDHDHPDTWSPLGTIAPGDRDRTFHDVPDQGDHWVVRYSYADQSVETPIDRTRLADDDWRVTVPDSLTELLRSAGVPETPR